MSGFSIAAFRYRVTLERPVATPDGAGGETETFETVRSVWARVRQNPRERGTQAGRRVNARDYTITLRRWTDIEPGWRVVFEGEPLAIESLTPVEPRRLYLKLHCTGGLGE